MAPITAPSSRGFVRGSLAIIERRSDLHDGRDEQDQDEWALELPEQQHEVADRWLRGEAVLAVLGEPRRCGVRIQSVARTVELPERLVRVERVPGRSGWRAGSGGGLGPWLGGTQGHLGCRLGCRLG